MPDQQEDSNPRGRPGTKGNPYPGITILVQETWALDVRAYFPTPGPHYTRHVHEQRQPLKLVSTAA